MSRTNRRAVSWLVGELPSLVASGVIAQEQAIAIERHYAADARPNRSVAFTIDKPLREFLRGDETR